jgi:hypothetical protein
LLFIENFVRFSLLLPLLIFFFFKRKRNDSVRVLLFFNLFFVTHDFIYSSLKIRYPEAGVLFNAFYIPLEFLFIHFFYKNIFTQPFYKKATIPILIIFYVLWILSTYYNTVYTFNSFINGVECIIVIFYSFLYFYDQIKTPKSFFIYSQPEFWGVIGFFLFFAGSFFVFLYKQSSRNIDNFLEQYIFIHSILFIFRNIAFSVALLIKPEKTPLADHQPSLT